LEGLHLLGFFALHYVLPFLVAILVFAHNVFLHETGSKTPISNLPKGDKLKFHTFYRWKDVFGFLLFFLGFLRISLLFMKLFFDPENFIEANPLVTPVHIQPEWYFLASYAILRSVPKKLGGVLGLVMSIRIFFFLPLLSKKKSRSFCNALIFQIIFCLWVFKFFLLSWIGSKPVEAPYSNIGVFLRILFFSFFLIF